jgi:hypothetical protein
MKKLLIFKLVFCVMLLTAIQSCKDDCENPCNKDCETYNPCNCETPLKADFVMEEKVWDRWFEIGSPLDGVRSIRYTVTTPKYDSCLWILGTETLRVAQFSRRGYPDKSTIKPMLIVYKSVDARCIGKLRTVDTLVRSFVTADPPLLLEEKQWPVLGSYKGYKKSNPNKEVIVTIDTIGPTIHTNLWGIHMTNIPYNDYYPARHLLRQDGTPQHAISRIPHIGSSSFVSTFEEGMFEGYGVLKSDELKIVYSYYKDTLINGIWDRESPILKDEFIGQRIK